MQIYLLYLIIMALIYSFDSVEYLKYIVFFICSLFIIYLGVLFLKIRNISDIIILIKYLLRIAWFVSLLINSNVNLITSYSNFIIENGLVDDVDVKKIYNRIGLTPFEQYYLSVCCCWIGWATGLVCGAVIIYYFLTDEPDPRDPANWPVPKPYKDDSDSDDGFFINNIDDLNNYYNSSDSDYSYYNDFFGSDIPMDIISESTVLPTVDLNGTEVVEYIITDSPEAEKINPPKVKNIEELIGGPVEYITTNVIVPESESKPGTIETVVLKSTEVLKYKYVLTTDAPKGGIIEVSFFNNEN